jgi:hypothetical protein
MSRNDLDPELVELEAALRSFDPVPSGVSRDQVMFLSGQASIRRSLAAGRRSRAFWLWPCATAVSWLAMFAMGGALLLKDQPQIVQVERKIDAAAPDVVMPPVVPDGQSQRKPGTGPAELHDPPIVTGIDWPPESRPIPSPKGKCFQMTGDPGREPRELFGS